MKRMTALILALTLIAAIASADMNDSVLFDQSLWGLSRSAFQKRVKNSLETVRIGSGTGLKLTGMNVYGYPMDAYFLFEAQIGAYYGFSKAVYILSDRAGFTEAELPLARDDLADQLTQKIGAPATASDAVVTWETDSYKIQIGQANLKSYTGCDGINLCIVIHGLNIPKPTVDALPSPANTPTPQPRATAEPAAKPTQKPSKAPEKVGTSTYVLNTNTKKFHRPDCSSVDEMKSRNREYVNMSRDEIIARGYKPCKRCKP